MTSDTELSSFIGKQHDFVSSTVWVDKKRGYEDNTKTAFHGGTTNKCLKEIIFGKL